MDCAQCGETNRDGARFCSGCGTPVALRCTNCQAELRPSAKFCDECGTPVGDPTPAATTPAAPAATATRKIVTALFADLVGSTSFGERADAEVARTVMARYHALLQSAIDAHSGTVSKFMGDGMMATFGIPEIAEDDALRAVRAGVDIQRRFTDFATQVQTQHGETLGLRVGVNTGEVVIADGDADLVGDALNVAARIEHACRPGQVTVGEDTWRLTRGEFGYDTLGEVTVAGRAQPVAIFEVAADTATAAVEMAAPFVGRTPEMERLRAVLGAAISARAARLVTVLGSPGVGKTRLSRELCTATEADDGAITFEIRCDRAGDSTFAPIAQLIRDATELGDDTDAASARERLGALLADDDADRDRLVDVLGGLVGAAPSRSVEETFWAVRRLVSATAVDRPMVVVIDDIQWAEPLLLDLLEHLAEWVQDVPLLLLCLARPELREVRPSLAERNRRVADVLALDGLDSAATEALAAGLLGTDRLPAGLVERLPTSTDGNPLFVRELVRMLVDDEVIRRRGDEWELAIDAEAVEVPPTIQSLLAARVERLPGDERAVLELAAVIGSEFNLGALRELAGANTPLPSLLESMRRKELVEPTGTYWGDEPVHRFHHVLIRDATYRRLLKTTRADLHEKVAVWTDAAAAGLIGEHEAVIAFHYEQAFRYRSELGSVDDHVTGLGRRAAELLSTASDRALGQDDLASAGALARRALALLPDTDAAARAELLTTACECTLASGDVVGARPVVEQLRAEAGDDPTLGAWASCFEAQLVGLTDPEGLVGAEAIATGAAKAMEELGDGAGEAKAHQVRAGLLARLGRVGDAELELDLALGAARRVDDRRRVTAVLGAAPLAALWGPSPVARAGGRCLDVVRLLRITTASPSVEATSMRCQAVLEALRGRFDVARSMLDSSRATLEELGLRHGLLETAYLTGVVELVAGDPAAAIGPLRDAYDGLIEMGVGIDAGRAAALLAHTLVAEGRVDDAEPMAAASEELAGQDLKTAIAWRVARAEVLAARGDVAGGVALAEEAVEIAAATDLVIDHADACVALAALHRQAGDVTAERSVREEAKRLYDLKGATVPSERLGAMPAAARSIPSPVPDAPTQERTTATDSRHPRAENIATQVGSELWKPLLAGDLERYRRLVTDDVVTADRRSLIGADLVGVDALLANMRATAEMGAIDVHFEPLAVRGSVLGLGRVTFDFGGFESCFLALGEVTIDGRLARGAMFDDDALVDAIDELAARYGAGEGAGSGASLATADQVISTVNRRQWSDCIDLYAPDLRHVDHRQIGLPVLDREGLIGTIREYCELTPDLVLCPRKLIAKDHVYLATTDVLGTTPDGSTVEWVQHAVGVLDVTGRISDLETYDDDDFAAALVRFDELGAVETVETRTPIAENDAATVLAQAWDLTVAGRFDEIGPLCADDAVVIDRQRIVGEDLVGRDAIVANCRAVAALGADAARVEPIAVRGSRLALCRTTVSFGSFENAFLSVCELDAQGLGRCIVTYDEDGLVAALDELDARYDAGEGSGGVPFSDFPVVNLVNRRDWSTLLDPDFPEFTQVDHRQLGWPTVDRQGWVATMQEYVDLVPDLVMVVRKFHTRGTAALTTLDPIGTTSDGSAVAWSVHTVMAEDPYGVIRMEAFDLDDFATALARLDELGAAAPTDPRHPRAENTATRTRVKVLTLFNTGRFDEARALLTDDLERVDLRTVVSMPTTLGLHDFVEASRASLEAGFTHQSHVPIAVRGDRLELSRVTLRSAEGYELVFLSIIEIDESGRVRGTTSFDEDALVPAIDELDARYVSGEGAPHARMLDTAIRTLAALSAEDWTALTALLTDDYAFVDHRQLSNPPLDREGYVAIQQMFAEQIRRRMVVRTFHPVEHAFLCTFDVTGTDAGGGAFEWVFHLVSTFDGEDRLAGSELFDEDDFPAALARLDELGSAPAASADPLGARLENAATRNGRRLLALINSGRIDEAAALLAPVLLNDDRRTTVAWGSNSREQLLEGIRAKFDLGLAAELREVIAIRGDGLSLVRIVWTSEAGDEIPQLTLAEIDADGRCTGWLTFDDEALDEALAELDARYLAGEGAEHADVLRPSMDHVAAFNCRDWAALLATMRPDIVIEDHRGLWPATSDRDAYLARMQSLAATSPDSVVISRRFVAAGNASLATYRVRGTSEHGERYEYDFHIASRVADTFPGFAFFADDDFAAAHTRFEEFVASPPTETHPRRVENAATRTVDRFFASALAGQFDDAGEHLAPDLVRVDHRTAVSDGTTHGRDAYLTALQSTFDVGFTEVTIDHLAVRGERLALFRSRFTTGSGLQLVMLSVGETTTRGLVAHLALYDEEAINDAIVELDARYYAGEGAPLAPLLRVGAQFIADLNAQDWTGLPAALTDDFSFTDHGQVGWPPLRRNEFLEMQKSYLDQIRQRFVARSVQARGRAVLTSIEIEGVDAGGGEFEWRFHTVAVFDADLRISCMESYAEDDFPAALARLDELGATEPTDPRRPSLENAASRWADRLNGQINGGSLDEVAGMYAVDVVAVDRRTTVSLPTLHGRAAIRDNMQALRDVGFNRFRSEALAVRGDRLVLQRVVFSTDDGREMTTLGLNEWVNGEVVRRVVFDEDALADALVELDRQYAAREGAEHADVIRVLSDGYAAMNRRDLDAWAALHAPDHSTHDHAPIGFGKLGTQTYGEYLQAAFEQIPDFVIVPATIEVDGSVALVGIPIQATTPDGFEFEKDLVVVTRLAPDRRIVEDHFFSDDQWAEARAMFENLVTSTTRSAPQIRNTVTDVVDRYVAQCATGEFGGEGFGATDFVRYDQRRGVSTPTQHSLAEFEANMRAIFEVFETATTEPVAIRGDRVALIRVHLAHAGFASSMLGVYETNEHGLLTRGTSFDDDDLDGAIEELDERFIAGEATDHEYLIRRARDFTRSLAQLDGAATLALLDPATEIVDHRPLGLGTFGLDGARAWHAARAEQVAEDVSFFRNLSVRGGATLGHLESRGVDDHGTAFLYEMCLVSHWVAGRARWVGQYSLDDHEAARARFEELAAETRTPYVDNPVMRLLARGTWLRRFVPDHDAFAGLAEDLVVVDNRSGVSLPDLHGADELVQASREQEDLFGPIEIEPVAVRGDRLALVHTRAVAPSGFETGGYGIFEIDEAGLQNAMTFFDDDDLLTALDTLDARYAEIAGPERAPAQAAFLDGIGLLNRQDWDGFAALLHPDLEAVDHSPLGFPTTGRDGFVDDQMRGMAELVPDFVVVVRKILAEGRATLVVGTTLGTTVDGNAYAWEFVQVMQTAVDGRGLRRDLYADTQWDEALARFDQLATEGGDAPEPENRITRRLHRWLLRTEHGAPTSSATIADNVVILDRRSGVSAGTISGREDFAANARAHFDVFADARITVLAVRGDRLALVRMEYRADGFVSPRLNLFEADESGRIVALVVLDEDDLDAAVEELDARHAAIESAAENRATLAGRRATDAFTRGDRAAALDAFAPDFTRSDRRRGPNIGAGVGREEYVNATLAGNEVGMAHFELTPLEQVGDDRALARIRWHNGDGFELEWLLVTEVDADGRIRRVTNFDVDQRAAASAVLHEWVAAAPQLTPRLAEAEAVRMDALARGDRDAVLATYTPDFVRDDRRRGINFGTSNREETVDALLAGPDVGLGNMAFTPVEVIGDHFALGEFRMSHDDGFELVYLLVVEQDDEGRLRRATNFDLEDHELASALLREWTAERGHEAG